jgi:hypothetical protein
MVLRGIKPEVVIPSKPKIMLSGKPGTGKSFFALNAPAPYLLDTEGGATREQYVGKLLKQRGSYLGIEQGSQDFSEVINQVRELATTKHPYKTLIIDSFSKLYNIEAAAAEERGGSDFGKDKREADKPTRKLLNWLGRLDMTVILVCHQKDKWIRQGGQLIMEGSTFDGYKKLDYELDLWLETKLVGTSRYATIVKSRIEGFPVGTDIDLDFASFEKLYGKAVVEAPVKPIVLAGESQIAEIKRLVDLLKVPEEEFSKWLTKAQAVEVDDLSADNAVKMLDFLNKKVKGEIK